MFFLEKTVLGVSKMNVWPKWGYVNENNERTFFIQSLFGKNVGKHTCFRAAHAPMILSTIGTYCITKFLSISLCVKSSEKRARTWEIDQKLYNTQIHSSEIRGLRSTKCSSETLQNLLHFMYKKTYVVFFFFHFV